MARIGFLFNHDQIHQVAHSLPIALELASRGKHEIVIATSDKRLEQRVRELAHGLDGQIDHVQLGVTSGLSGSIARITENLIPARKILLYRDNLDFFRSLDALVVSEKTSLLLKTRYGLTDLPLIHTRHGAGDRAIGFSKESALFDMVLVSGPKIARRLVADAGVDPTHIRETGYPKFDLFARNRIDNPFPDPTLPIVLYSPHPSPNLSSYYKAGPAILSAFARCNRYNLIFAPHVMLFERKWTVTISPPAIRKPPPVPREALDCPHILVDPGSPASTDMSYTNLADVYIGDVSSQIYEFLLHPRPVLHVDAHATAWQDDEAYGHWRAGPVVTPQDDIVSAVDSAISVHSSFLPTQQAMLKDTFSVTKEPSASRAASAISEYCEARANSS